MGFKSNSRALAIAATFAASAAAVSPAAAGVVVFSNVSAAWSDPTPGSGITIANGAPTSTASWGTPALGNKQSSYSFTGNGVVTDDLVSGGSDGPFQLGEFQHNNWPITGTSLTSIKLLFTADVSVDGNDVGPQTFEFLFHHDETPNNGTNGACKYGGTPGSGINTYGCADQVSVESNTLQNIFTFGKDTYTLEIAGFFSGGNLTETFLTKEGKVEEVTTYYWHYGQKKKKKELVYTAFPNKAYVMGTVHMVTSAIPEPSTWAMLIVGFGGVGSMLRANRRRLVPVLA